jgi:valyl-tRNA synthetase
MLSYNEISSAEFGQVQQLVTEARFVATSLPGNAKYGLLYQQDSLMEDNAQLITRLARLKVIEKTTETRGIRLALANRDAWLDVSAETLAEHQTNLEVRLASTHKELQVLSGRLSNEGYLKQAPAALVEETKKQQIEKQALIERLQHELEVLN